MFNLKYRNPSLDNIQLKDFMFRHQFIYTPIIVATILTSLLLLIINPSVNPFQLTAAENTNSSIINSFKNDNKEKENLEEIPVPLPIKSQSLPAKKTGSTSSGESKATNNIIVPNIAPIHVNQRSFSIPFNLSEAGPNSPDPAIEVELLYTMNFGKNWFSFGRLNTVNRKSEFFFRAAKDGEYWFALRTWYRSGRQTVSAAHKILIRQEQSSSSSVPVISLQEPSSIAPSLSNTEDGLSSNLKKNPLNTPQEGASSVPDLPKSPESLSPRTIGSKPNSTETIAKSNKPSLDSIAEKRSKPNQSTIEQDNKEKIAGLKSPIDRSIPELKKDQSKNPPALTVSDPVPKNKLSDSPSPPTSQNDLPKLPQNKESESIATKQPKPIDSQPTAEGLKLSQVPALGEQQKERPKPVPAPSAPPKVDPKTLVKAAPLTVPDLKAKSPGSNESTPSKSTEFPASTKKIPAPSETLAKLEVNSGTTQSEVIPKVNAEFKGAEKLPEPLALPPLHERGKSSSATASNSKSAPDSTSSSGSSSIGGESAHVKRLLEIAGTPNDSITGNAESSEKEDVPPELIFPGKIKNLAIGRTPNGEPTIMVRWFRPEETGTKSKSIGTLSIERSDSPNGPWTTIAAKLDINEKGYWWKATSYDAVPFYLRTVSVDSYGKEWKDTISKRLELASQLRDRIPGIPDDNKIASIPQTAKNGDTAAAHNSIRAWRGPNDSVDQSPFKEVGLEKATRDSSNIGSGHSGNTNSVSASNKSENGSGQDVSKTTSVSEGSKSDPASAYQDLNPNQNSPNPRELNRESNRGPVQRPTDPNQFSLNPIFTQGFSVLFNSPSGQSRSAAESSEASASERRSIFTSPQTYRNMNQRDNQNQNYQQNDGQFGGNFGNGYDSNGQEIYNGMPNGGNTGSPGPVPGNGMMPNAGDVIYLDEKGNRIDNPFTNGLVGSNGQQYIPQNGVFVDQNGMTMPNGMPMQNGGYPDVSFQNSGYSPNMAMPNGMNGAMPYPDGGLPADMSPVMPQPDTGGRSYIGGSSNPAPKQRPSRDYSNP